MSFAPIKITIRVLFAVEEWAGSAAKKLSWEALRAGPVSLLPSRVVPSHTERKKFLAQREGEKWANKKEGSGILLLQM